MGVPKFFRWLSERYPKINQAIYCPPNPETRSSYFGNDFTNGSGDITDELKVKDQKVVFENELHILKEKTSIVPEFDRLYLDMNGIIHCCSHNNIGNNMNTVVNENEHSDDRTEGTVNISNESIFRNICYYIDRVVSDIIKPKELIYMAIDGVAPRAKINQQRSRRYRSGNETEIELKFRDTHFPEKVERKVNRNIRNDYIYSAGKVNNKCNEMGTMYGKSKKKSHHDNSFNVDYTTFQKFLYQGEDIFKCSQKELNSNLFHSNVITPGTLFFEHCTSHLKKFIQYKLHSDPQWHNLTIIFSGPNVPGEGEHKIMDFIRKQKLLDDYNPNTKHCLFGQDGDLIMLGLASHEPNFCLLREEVIFDQTKRVSSLNSLLSYSAALTLKDTSSVLPRNHTTNKDTNSFVSASLDMFMNNSNFELLHMSILRDYLAYEFETNDIQPNSLFELEPTIDDFVFMTFLVGNDFLPSIPTLDIANEAFDFLFFIYKKNRKLWLNDNIDIPYINRQTKVNKAPMTCRKKKESSRKKSFPYLIHEGSIVSGFRLEKFLSEVAKHEQTYFDTYSERYRQSDISMPKGNNTVKIFPDNKTSCKIDNGGIFSRMITFFSNVFTSPNNNLHTIKSSKDSNGMTVGGIITKKSDVTDTKALYYYDKFQISTFDINEHLSLRKSYMEGLIWNLLYYYRGCVCWEWFYPYHYAPLLSDLKNIDDLIKDIKFDKSLSEPLRPFEQLLCCLPPSSAPLLPKPYSWLMKSPHSPIIDFYPDNFEVDMNGKKWHWEAVVLLPFINFKRLTECIKALGINNMLSDEENKRNEVGDPLVFVRDESQEAGTSFGDDFSSIQRINESYTKSETLCHTHWDIGNIISGKDIVFKPKLLVGTQTPSAGFPTLKTVPVNCLNRKKIGINVHGIKSRYKTAILNSDDDFPELPAAQIIGPKIIGTTVYFRYPFLQEGFVTSVSDMEITVRGSNAPRKWNKKEALLWKHQNESIQKQYEYGVGITGTGGWRIPESQTTISVRPLKGIKTLKDGTRLKVFLQAEVEVPIFAALWSPSYVDPRLVNVQTLLEKNPYRFENSYLSSKTISSRRKNKDSICLNEQAKLRPSYGTYNILMPPSTSVRRYSSHLDSITFFPRHDFSSVRSLMSSDISVLKNKPLKEDGKSFKTIQFRGLLVTRLSDITCRYFNCACKKSNISQLGLILTKNVYTPSASSIHALIPRKYYVYTRLGTVTSLYFSTLKSMILKYCHHRSG